MELQVHVLQGFLHMQDMRRAVLDEFGPVAQISPQDYHLGVWSEGTIEQAQPVQLL
jgi:hypothetical protein